MFKSKNRNAVLALILTLGSSIVMFNQTPILAQEIAPAHLEAAKKAISVTGATTKLNDILPAAAARLTGRLISNRPDIESEITNIVNESALTLAPRRGDLEKEVAKIYARVFSQDELNKLAEFFATEAGKKFLNNLPLVVREVDKAARIWGTGINRDLAQDVQKKLEAAGL